MWWMVSRWLYRYHKARSQGHQAVLLPAVFRCGFLLFHSTYMFNSVVVTMDAQFILTSQSVLRVNHLFSIRVSIRNQNASIKLNAILDTNLILFATWGLYSIAFCLADYVHVSKNYRFFVCVEMTFFVFVPWAGLVKWCEHSPTTKMGHFTVDSGAYLICVSFLCCWFFSSYSRFPLLPKTKFRFDLLWVSMIWSLLN